MFYNLDLNCIESVFFTTRSGVLEKSFNIISVNIEAGSAEWFGCCTKLKSGAKIPCFSFKALFSRE